MGTSGFDDLPWDIIKELSEKGIFENVYKKIPKSRFEFVIMEENRERLISAALKSLQKKNPYTTYNQAVDLANLMQAFAKKVLDG